MPRLNIDDDLFSDERYLCLVDEIGRERAMGRVIFFWKLAQKFYLDGDGGGGIPIEIFDRKDDWKILLTVGLAEKRDNEIYAKGADSQFAWILHKKTAGKAGGKKSAELRSSKTQANASKRKQTSSESNPLTLTPALTRNNKLPKGNSSKRCSDSSVKIPAQNLVNLWNENRGSLPEIKKIPKRRVEKIRARLREEPDLAYWKKVFQETAQNSFLNGSGNSDRGWRATFDWLMSNDTNHCKVSEGNYTQQESGDWLKNWVPPEERQNANATN